MFFIECNIQMTKKHKAELQRKPSPSYKCFAIITNFRFTYKTIFDIKLSLEKCLYRFIVSFLDSGKQQFNYNLIISFCFDNDDVI